MSVTFASNLNEALQKSEPHRVDPPAVKPSGDDIPPDICDEPQGDGIGLGDFHAHMPSHQYLFIPTRELWPAASVNGRVRWPKIDDKPVAPATWLDKHRAIERGRTARPLDRVEEGRQIPEQGRVQGVQRLGPVQGHHGVSVGVPLDQKVGVGFGHGKLPEWRVASGE